MDPTPTSVAALRFLNETVLLISKQRHSGTTFRQNSVNVSTCLPKVENFKLRDLKPRGFFHHENSAFLLRIWRVPLFETPIWEQEGRCLAHVSLMFSTPAFQMHKPFTLEVNDEANREIREESFTFSPYFFLDYFAIV